MSDNVQDEKLENAPPDGAGSPVDESADAQGSEAESAGSADSPEEREARLRQEAADNWSKYLRAAAELENLRKRASRDVEHARKYGVERLAEAILPVRDSIEAALTALNGAESIDVRAVLAGEHATLRLLDQVLEASGVREIDPHGEPFDPARHEAMGMVESSEMEPHSVLEVVQKGYSLHDRILRPARVIVAKEPATSD